MSLVVTSVGTIRNRVHGKEHIIRPPQAVIAERDARQEADTRSDIQKWLNEPPPGRSALDAHRQWQRQLEARPRINISAAPRTKAEASSASGLKLGGLVTAPSGPRRDLVPEPVPVPEPPRLLSKTARRNLIAQSAAQ
jgi:hypothetical protein